MSAPSEDGNAPVWGNGFDLVIKKQGEEAESLYILHYRSAILSTKYNDYIQIPSIILQTLTGFLSASSNLVPPIALGAVSIFTAILATFLSYYKFSAKAANHKVASTLYFKIYKSVEVTLSLPPEQREDAEKLLADLRDKLARISEIAPDLSESVIADYKKEFKDSLASKPLVANGLSTIELYKRPSLVSVDSPGIPIKLITPK